MAAPVVNKPSVEIRVRHTQEGDFLAISEICRRVYPCTPPWSDAELRAHQQRFPEGQAVAMEASQGRVVGMDASLIVDWHHYRFKDSWNEFTSHGTFANHDPKGGTLYAAEIMIDPDWQHHHIGGLLYAERRALARRLSLLRIRGGSRLRGFGKHAGKLTPHDYVLEVVHGRLVDPTLSFQLHEGFHVMAIVSGYLDNDPESLGFAAVIEWLNPDLARPEHMDGRDPRFIKK